MGNFSVYMHINKANGKVYVGITSQSPPVRWQNGTGYRHNEYFTRAIRKYGWEGFSHLIIAEGLTKEEACKMEVSLIKRYDSTNRDKGYNRSIGGECGRLGVIASKEVRRKLSESHKGVIPWNKGKKMPEEFCLKLSEVHKGKFKGQDNPFFGKHHTDEARKKMGRPLTDEQKKMLSERSKKPVKCIETGNIYPSLKSANEKTGVSYKALSNHLRRPERYKKAGGFHWEYAEVANNE